MLKFLKSLIVALAVVGFLLAVFFAGVYVGAAKPPVVQEIASVANKETNKPDDVDFDLFWQTWAMLDEKYVDGNSTTTLATSTSLNQITADNQKRVYGAISGMVQSLGDPYTVFFPPKEKKLFEEEIRGNFGGVGMEVGMRGGALTVISPLKDSPAIKAGIRPGDQIIKIDDQSTAGFSVEDGVGLIRGEKGTAVDITLAREGVKEPIKVSIIRDTIVIPTLETEIVIRKTASGEQKIFIIHLYNFGEDASNAFRRALREFVESNTDKLIIDLRGNPGGYLDAAIDIASFFLPQGKVVVEEYSGNGKNDQVFRSKGYDVFGDKLKLAILIDKGSASASEILAGALSEHGRAVLVGEQTFGKGSVQELISLNNNTSLKVTIARWLTPNGVHISQGGLKPAYEVIIKPEDYNLIREKKKADPQVEKAIELLLK